MGTTFSLQYFISSSRVVPLEQAPPPLKGKIRTSARTDVLFIQVCLNFSKNDNFEFFLPVMSGLFRLCSIVHQTPCRHSAFVRRVMVLSPIKHIATSWKQSVVHETIVALGGIFILCLLVPFASLPTCALAVNSLGFFLCVCETMSWYAPPPPGSPVLTNLQAAGRGTPDRKVICLIRIIVCIMP